ncbi:D-alanine--D-alanine ligase [Leptospira sp. 201903071]|uniref:D-alanine--D-alanine ligase family protein n=1 Tax=Leptospira ainazelensis TaxID=2810034 RepID=UPI001962ADBF|nr:D-alanine--D-alanine ligase [Leptospira ainazelensis]MBM9501278.1 D-alanine--D-alanine ligase [Leptospira ainazelensis]
MNEVIPTVLVYADLHEFSGEFPDSYKQEWESRASVEKIMELLNELGEVVELATTPRDLLEKLNLYSSLEFRDRPVIFHLMEGFRSRNREALIPATAELFGFPHTGSDAFSQNVSLDKNLTKIFAKSLGIPVAKGFSISFADRENFTLPKEISFPCFLKPSGEGSSLGIGEKSVVGNEKELRSRLVQLPEEYFPYLAEDYLKGSEYTVSVMGSLAYGYRVSPAGRLILKDDLKVEEVYGEKTKSKSVMPEVLVFDCPAERELFLQEQSVLFCKTLGSSGPARLDWKCNEEGEPFFLEINLTPGLSPFYSTFPICYRQALGEEKSLFSEILKIARLDGETPRFLYSKLKTDFLLTKK